VTRSGRIVAEIVRRAFTRLQCEHSSPYALDNRKVGFGGNDTPKPEPGSPQQLPELRLGALSAAWCEHQHLEIQEFAEVRTVAWRDDGVDD
jgi:hypothetical protein